MIFWLFSSIQSCSQHSTDPSKLLVLSKRMRLTNVRCKGCWKNSSPVIRISSTWKSVSGQVLFQRQIIAKARWMHNDSRMFVKASCNYWKSFRAFKSDQQVKEALQVNNTLIEGKSKELPKFSLRLFCATKATHFLVPLWWKKDQDEAPNQEGYGDCLVLCCQNLYTTTSWILAKLSQQRSIAKKSTECIKNW